MKRAFSRIISLFAAFVLLLCFASPSFATQTTGELNFEISASNSSVKVGNTVDITITLKNTTAFEISDLRFKYTYDNTKFGISQSSTSVSPDWSLSHSATAITGSGGVLDISYSASDRAINKPIGVNEFFSVTIKMLALTTNTSAATSAFNLSEATAFMRTDITKSATTDDNLSHTFTFNPTYPSASVSITALSNNANLTSLVPMVSNTEKELTPAFSPDITEYRMTVLYDFPGIEFTVTRADSKASAELISPKNNKYEVGDNTVKIIVTAEDKTTKTYTIIVNRLAAGQTLPSSTTSSTTAAPVSGGDVTTAPTTTEPTTMPSVEPTEPTEYTNPAPAGTTTIVKEGGLDTTIHLNLATLLGLVAGEIALFLLAFYSGYLTHKNALRPDKLSLEDILAAQEQLANAAEDEEPESDEESEEEQTEGGEDQQGEDGYYPEQYGEGEYDPNQYGQGEYDSNQYGQGYSPEYGDYGQTYNQPGMFDGYTQEYSPTAPAQQESEYDEYGYNAEGESNYQQTGPSSSLYYS